MLVDNLIGILLYILLSLKKKTRDNQWKRAEYKNQTRTKCRPLDENKSFGFFYQVVENTDTT